jgi:Zn-dependent protease/predicted transcriptional regulator
VFGNSWRLGRIAGIELRIDTSWVVIAVLVTYSMYIDLAGPGLGAPAAIALAVFFALLFFASVLIHEFAHALVAQARGIPVRGITLFLFGGATQAKVESRGPKDEFLISVVGPLTSLALGGVFLGLSSLGLPRPLDGGMRYLGVINIALAVFNLLPGFPLDGGRVLRSAVWKATGSLPRATTVASIAGQTVGYVLVAVGVFLVFTENLFSGIWLGMIGWFLTQAARSQAEELRMRQVLHGIEAEDLMAADLVTIPSDLTVRDAVDRFFMRYDHGAFPVEDDGHTVGLLTLRAVKGIPQQEWDARAVQEVMEPIGEQCTVPADARMDNVLAKMQEGKTRRCLVVRNGEVVGIITPFDVTRWFQRRRALRA